LKNIFFILKSLIRVGRNFFKNYRIKTAFNFRHKKSGLTLSAVEVVGNTRITNKQIRIPAAFILILVILLKLPTFQRQEYNKMLLHYVLFRTF